MLRFIYQHSHQQSQRDQFVNLSRHADYNDDNDVSDRDSPDSDTARKKSLSSLFVVHKYNTMVSGPLRTARLVIYSLV